MSETYTKLFKSILASTVWQKDNDTKLVWVTMLAMADADGYVAASVPGLAAFSGVSQASVIRALEDFMSPDPFSRTKDFEGRRVVEVERGWKLLNHGKFTAMASKETRRNQLKNAQAKQREKKRQATGFHAPPDDDAYEPVFDPPLDEPWGSEL
jgi:hypothetical protein